MCLVAGSIAGSKAAVHVGPTAGLLDHLLWHYTPYAVLIIMPLFALANCAVEVDMSVISGVLHTPVAHGIMVRIICIQRLGPHIAARCKYPRATSTMRLPSLGMP
ncbi:hypothetical protein CYMTET_36448 [Cymbomonas tetramitiformis]|uniref:Uncharacterized protein n=1 Tax=Cymbomonas tetramitiformis TaxID=36881 RepID=A0AAE0CG13_9CHLO|nr:hypothetical protein CYMTET_36448 [Cymbomonas tetramitiformis]